jgi:acyl carrier protein
MSDDITVRVQRIVADIAKKADPSEVPTDGDLYRDLGVKSTAALDLLLSLEDEFGVAIPDDQFGDARTVASLAQMIGELQ